MKIDKKKEYDQLITDIFPLNQKGHALRSRRDLFAQGFYGFGAYIALPSIATLALEKLAYGEECASKPEEKSAMSGMMCFDIAGGWTGAGSNIIVGQNNSQTNFLPHYRTNGMPDALHPDITGVNQEFGLRMHPNSGFLAGLREATSVATRANTDGAVFCNISIDDTTNNPHSPVFAISQAAQRGRLVNILGSDPNSVSGSRARSPSELLDPANRAVTVRNENEAMNVVQLGRLTSDIFNSTNDKKNADVIMKKIRELSSSRLAKFNEQDLPRQLKELVDCGYFDASNFSNRYGPEALNPTLDPDVIGTAAAPGAFSRFNNGTNVFNNQALNFNGNTGNIPVNLTRQVQTMAKLVLDGVATVSTSVLGGYDYHGNPRVLTDGRDYQVGKLVGASLELAARKKENLIIYVYSDGSTSSGTDIDSTSLGVTKYSARSDSGTRGIAFMLVYGAHGRPEIRNEGRQVGSFNTLGAVDLGFNLITNSPDNLTKAVIANYLALHGRESELKNFVEVDPFGRDLDQYLVFGKFKKAS